MLSSQQQVTVGTTGLVTSKTSVHSETDFCRREFPYNTRRLVEAKKHTYE